MLATTLSGWIVDQVGSYQSIFIANLILSLVVVFGFGFIVREPRSGRLLRPYPHAPQLRLGADMNDVGETLAAKGRQ